MGTLLNEKEFLNKNIFNYTGRMESQFTRFLTTQPTFVTYYKINSNETTTDLGLYNVETLIGNRSPVKYNKIIDFPVYGLDDIRLDIDDGDEGLNTNYTADVIILPNTIVPSPNDMFFITYLDKSFVFIVTSMEYDTIKSNNFYKVGIALKDISDVIQDQLDEQVVDTYDCVFRNIGTEDKCILRSDDHEKCKELSLIKERLQENFMLHYYSDFFNTIVVRGNDENYIYDKYLVKFIIENKLLFNQYSYKTIALSNILWNRADDIIYSTSVYTDIERGNVLRENGCDIDILSKPVGTSFSMIDDTVHIINLKRHVSESNPLYLSYGIYSTIELHYAYDKLYTVIELLEKSNVKLDEIITHIGKLVYGVGIRTDYLDSLTNIRDTGKDVKWYDISELLLETNSLYDLVVLENDITGFLNDELVQSIKDPLNKIVETLCAVLKSIDYRHVFIARSSINRINNIKDINIEKLYNIEAFTDNKDDVYLTALILFYLDKLIKKIKTLT